MKTEKNPERAIRKAPEFETLELRYKANKPVFVPKPESKTTPPSFAHASWEADLPDDRPSLQLWTFELYGRKLAPVAQRRNRDPLVGYRPSLRRLKIDNPAMEDAVSLNEYWLVEPKTWVVSGKTRTGLPIVEITGSLVKKFQMHQNAVTYVSSKTGEKVIRFFGRDRNEEIRQKRVDWLDVELCLALASSPKNPDSYLDPEKLYAAL